MTNHKVASFENWRLNAFAFGCVVFACFLTSLTHGDDEKRPATAASQPSTAAELMRQSHEGRAEWHHFPGYRAELRATIDGAIQEGMVEVSPEEDIKLNLPDSESFKWVKGSLKSLVGHRLPNNDVIQKVEFADQMTAHPLGRLLKSTIESDKSLWRVQGDVLTEVHRFNGKTRFVISVTDVSCNREGKHLPKSFNVTTWDSISGQIKTNRQVLNEWTRIGSIDLPAKLLAAINTEDGTRRVEQIELTGHELLSGQGANE